MSLSLYLCETISYLGPIRKGVFARSLFVCVIPFVGVVVLVDVLSAVPVE